MKSTPSSILAVAVLLLLISPAAMLHADDKPATPATVLQRFVAIDNVCCWPNLTHLPDGTIVATIFNQPTHGGWEGDVECWASRDGRLWEKRGTPAPHEPGTNRMNVGAGLARDGSLIVLASGWSNRPTPGTGRGHRIPDEADTLPIWICRSSDGGRTWTRSDKPVPPPPGGPTRIMPFGDIVKLADGALGVCIYSWSVPTKEFNNYFYASKDDGRTWEARGMVRKGKINETTPLVLPNGRLLAAGRTLDDQHLDLFASDDHGATWNCTGAVTAGSQHPADLMMLADGRVLLSYGNRVKGQFGVEAKLSSDGGVTWSDPISLVSDLSSGDCGYPSSVQLPGGEMVTAYYAAGVASHQRYHMGTVIWKLPSTTAAESGEKAAALDIGSRRELFVDDALVQKLTGKAELRLHHPVPQEIVITHDAAWEGSATGYHSIFKDGDRYRMYYRGWHLTVEAGKLKSNEHPMFYCYAESKDGIRWTKPELGLHEFKGSKANNIVMIGGPAGNMTLDMENAAFFRDDNPQAAPDARYKALMHSKKPNGMAAFKSADGLRWCLMSDAPVITAGAFDSHNVAFWDSVRGEYRAYWRYFTAGVTDEKNWKPGGHRDIRTATSKDFLHWEDQQNLSYADSPAEELYTNAVMPYRRAPHLLIGFPTRYIERGWSDSMRALPERGHRELRAKFSERYGTAITEGLFMASRDGVKFKRWNEAFLRPGIERPSTWFYGSHYLGWQVVETKSALEGGPNELSLYATENYWTGASKSCALRRYTLRLDGFVSVSAPMSGGELITKPLTFKGATLTLNFATSAAGSVRVEIQDTGGKALPGFTLDDCPPIFGDAIERTVTWKSVGDVSALAGKPVRLRFVMKDADVFAFRFAP